MRFRNVIILLAVLIVLAGVFYILSQSKKPTGPEPQEYVWLIEMDDITHVEISLPRENASQQFIKIVQEDKFPWFFDDATHSPVDAIRWSAGVPLLLSGPAANRKVMDNAPPEKLAEFGLTQPQMTIVLTLQNQSVLQITVGDRTPDGKRVYVRVPNSNTVATVDASWYELLSGLVKKPPYASAK